MQANQAYKWKFAKFGGVTQVRCTTGEDLLHLRELDLKLWSALSMPVNGIFFNADTLRMIDTDADGFIKPDEILNAVDWICANVKNPQLLLTAGETVPVTEIKKEDLAASAQALLNRINKCDKSAIAVEDVYIQKKFFTEHVLSNSGDIADDASDEEKLHKTLESLIADSSECITGNCDSEAERILNMFYEQAHAFLMWHDHLEQSGILPLSAEQTEKALAALRTVEEKIDDFFTRCKLAQYEPNTKEALCAAGDAFKGLLTQPLSSAHEFLLSLPIASIDKDKALPLNAGINPAWEDKIKIFAERAVIPLIGKTDKLSQNDWNTVKAKLTAYAAWQKSKPETGVSKIDASYISAAVKRDQKEKLLRFIKKTISIEAERAKISDLEKLVLYRRDIVRLLNNFVSFADFYEGKGSLFQAGILYFDARSANLCFYITDDTRHSALDPMSGSFLVYCDIKRLGETKKLLAVFTNGSGSSIVVGRNGVFYDRSGNDWDATVTKITTNPISLKEAFFMPYRKLSTMIEEQIARRAAEADKKSEEKLSKTAIAVTAADKTAAQNIPLIPKKIDLGAVALIGTAIGGISALISGILQALFGLGLWVPVGIVGLMLLISGPSTILAAVKLRKRSIGPILEANGWAINTQLKINIPFGTSMTKLGVIPPKSILAGKDPFADKKSVKYWCIGILTAAALIALVFLMLRFGFKISVKEWLTSLFK